MHALAVSKLAVNIHECCSQIYICKLYL